MLLIVGYSHKDENGSASIIVVNIATTGEGKRRRRWRRRNTTVLHVYYDQHVRASSIDFPMRASQMLPIFVPAMLIYLDRSGALTNVILDIVLNEGDPNSKITFSSLEFYCKRFTLRWLSLATSTSLEMLLKVCQIDRIYRRRSASSGRSLWAGRVFVVLE